MPTIQVNGRQAFYQNGGVDWQPGRQFLVFIHGAGVNHVVWQQQSRALAHKGFNVAALDLPGHGRSADQPNLDSTAAHAEWIAAFMEAAGMERAVLIGHSLGAAMAMHLATAHPRRTEALVLIGGGLEMLVNQKLLDDTEHNKSRAEDFITAYAHGLPIHLGTSPTPGSRVLGAAAALLGGCTPQVLHRDFQVCNDFDGKPLAAEVQCPVLVIGGDKDRMTPLKVMRTMAGAIPGARLEVVPGAGHYVQTEAPRIMLKLLRSFLAGLPQADAANRAAS